MSDFYGFRKDQGDDSNQNLMDGLSRTHTSGVHREISAAWAPPEKKTGHSDSANTPELAHAQAASEPVQHTGQALEQAPSPKFDSARAKMSVANGTPQESLRSTSNQSRSAEAGVAPTASPSHMPLAAENAPKISSNNSEFGSALQVRGQETAKQTLINDSVQKGVNTGEAGNIAVDHEYPISSLPIKPAMEYPVAPTVHSEQLAAVAEQNKSSRVAPSSAAPLFENNPHADSTRTVGTVAQNVGVERNDSTKPSNSAPLEDRTNLKHAETPSSNLTAQGTARSVEHNTNVGSSPLKSAERQNLPEAVSQKHLDDAPKGSALPLIDTPILAGSITKTEQPSPVQAPTIGKTLTDACPIKHMAKDEVSCATPAQQARDYPQPSFRPADQQTLDTQVKAFQANHTSRPAEQLTIDGQSKVPTIESRNETSRSIY